MIRRLWRAAARHPGNAFMVLLILMGAAAWPQKPILGGLVMLVVFGPFWLFGLWDSR